MKARLSRASGIPPDVLSKILSGTRRLQIDEAEKLRAAIDGVPPSEAEETPNVRPAPEVRLEPTGKRLEDLPVRGVVLGGSDGAVDLNLQGAPLEYVRRPLSLIGRGDIYALHVEGSSMFPAYRPGETVLVWGAKPALVGRDVVVQLRPKVEGDPPPAFLKTLIKRTSGELTVEQYNPPRKRVFKLTDVVAVHMVLTRDEML